MDRLRTRRRVVGLALGSLGIGGMIGCDPEPTAHASPPRVEVERALAEPTVEVREIDEPAPEDVIDDEVVIDPPRATHEALRLLRPPPRAPVEVEPYHVDPPDRGWRTALAWQFDAPVFSRPSAARRPAGLIRRNTRVAVERLVSGEGCSRRWAELRGGGYVCPGDGFQVALDPSPLADSLQLEPPVVEDALPYRYAKLETLAPIYWRVPTEAELASGSSDPIREHAQGAVFVALEQRVTVGDEPMSRTVRGFYVRDRDVEPKPAATMQGELLMGDDALPLGFVRHDETALIDPDSGAPVGVAERFARFTVQGDRERAGQALVVATDGFAVAADDVRVARAHPRPDEVGADEPWIHVDLSQQVLVAYEGDRPVLATLVSSGKAGFEPPLGLFRVHKKYTTVTMSGPDPDAGTYAVEEVPWTLYYWGSFALHGAYWHDEFGQERSHGCTNLPPLDAHWLYHWATPELPAGWHAALGIRGPWVLVTR